MPTLKRFGPWSFVLALFSSVTSLAIQDNKKPLDTSQESSVLEQALDRVDFENDGRSNRLLFVRVRVQSDVGVQQYGVLSFPYARATDTIAIDYIRVRKADGSILSTPLDDAQDMPGEVTREAPFYSDLYEKHVAVRGLSSGDLLEYQVRWKSNSLAPGQFWIDFQFLRNAVVLEQKIVITVPKERQTKVKSPSLPPVVSEEGSHRVYTWTRSNLARETTPDANLIQFATRGRFPGPDIRLSSFQSWDELARWYDSLQRDRVVPSEEVRSKAAELTRDAPDEDAKIRALYKYVSTQFRYVGISFGVGRYQPHFAGEVLTNQYGDCKDKHTLLAALFAASGISAYPVLIPSAHMLDPDIPSPSQFDHLITALPRAKDILFLDATPEIAPFGFLAVHLREKQALIVLPGKGGALEPTPADTPFPTSWVFKIDARLDGSGALEGKVEQAIRGDIEVELRAALHDTPRTQWKELIQRVSYSMGFGGEISDLDVNGFADTESPLHLTYTYKRKDYPDWEHRRFVFPAPEVVPSPALNEEKLPTSFWLGSPGEFAFESRVLLPSGYAPQLIPKTDIERDFLEYHASFSFENNTAVARYRIVIKKREVSGSALTDYKKFAESVANDRNRYVPVLPASGQTESQGEILYALVQKIQNLPDSADPKALDFERDAKAAWQQARLLDAIDAFKHAVTQDAKFTRAWLLMAEAQLAEGRLDAALEEFHRAIESDTKQAVSYKLLAYVLSAHQHMDESFQVWQDLAKAVPDDTDAPLVVGGILISKKQYSDAVPPLEIAVKNNPGKVAPLAQLGTAYLHLGRDADAMTMFEKSITLNPSPSTRNAVAWQLVLSNKELDRALRYAQDAVRGEEEESRKVQLDKLGIGDLLHPVALAAYWDTLGWIYYGLGNFKLAEQYLYPAWTLRQSPVIGYHLAQVYEKQKRLAQAVRVYRLVTTLTAAPGDEQDAVSETTQSLAHLKVTPPYRSGPQARSSNFASELSVDRTSKLPYLVSKHAFGEFFLLFSPGPKVEDVKFISGTDELRSADKVLRLAKFKVPFPENSSARLLRRGILACYPISGCTFVLLTPETVRNVN
jgi:tetratricopeptide (TPR) repeat protein